MTCDRAFFLHSFSVDGACLFLRIRGELAIGAHLRAADLYTVGSFDPDHDAVMRIGGEAPGGGPILSVGILCHVMCRFPPPRIVNRQSALNASASAEEVKDALPRGLSQPDAR